MDIIEILKQDYQKFPVDQTYSIYAKDVYFQDSVFKFRGIELYKLMIGFIRTCFLDLKFDLHDISRKDNLIETRWTLSWTTPLPWKPRVSVSGRSELQVDSAGLIYSHIDYWDCSRLDVLKQTFLSTNKS